MTDWIGGWAVRGLNWREAVGKQLDQIALEIELVLL
jgi:hypothetical protein